MALKKKVKKTATKTMGKKKSSVIKVDFEGVTTRKLVAEGDYRAKPIEASVETGSDSGKKYIQWTFEIQGGSFKGSHLPYNTSLQPQALWNLRGLLEALEVEVEDSAMDIDLKEIIDSESECGITVEHDTYEGRRQSKIVDIFSAKNLEETEEGGEEGEEGETEEVEVTKEDIMAMSEDELTEFNEANDLGVDLDEHEKLSAKRKAMVAAFEEATEGGEESDGEGEEVEVTEESILEMGKDELKQLVEDNELEVELTGTTARQRRMVIKAAKAAELI